MREKNVKLIGAMISAKMHAKELATKARVTPATVSRAVNYRVRPKPETVKAIARALGKSPADIGLGGDRE